MFDFSKYNLQELQAMSDLLDYLQELQAMSDLLDYLREYSGADALSYFCGCSLLQAIKRESLRLSRSILMSLEEQAHEHEAADTPPAEEPEGLQAVVDALSWCSNRLAALAAAEDKHFAECSRVDVFNKLTALRSANWSIIDLLADIRDNYDGLH